jgi:hypothetical protein
MTLGWSVEKFVPKVSEEKKKPAAKKAAKGKKPAAKRAAAKKTKPKRQGKK